MWCISILSFLSDNLNQRKPNQSAIKVRVAVEAAPQSKRDREIILEIPAIILQLIYIWFITMRTVKIITTPQTD